MADPLSEATVEAPAEGPAPVDPAYLDRVRSELHEREDGTP